MKEIIIQAKFDCIIGNRIVETGDKLIAREDVEGLYWIYLGDEYEPLIRLTPHDVDKLAKAKVT